MPGRRAKQIAQFHNRQLHCCCVQENRPGEAIIQDLARAKRLLQGHSLVGGYPRRFWVGSILDGLSRRMQFLILLNVLPKDGYPEEKQTRHYDSFFLWLREPTK